MANSDIEVKVRAEILETNESVHNLSLRIDRVVEGFTTQVQALNEAHANSLRMIVEMNEMVQIAMGDVLRLSEWIGADTEDGPFYPEFKKLVERLDSIAPKVEGRNKSAPVHRNMTDSDAIEVLKGQYLEMGHKEAATSIGLTYAQVYSCRMAYTFKHVHRALEKEGWKTSWHR